MCLQRKMKGKSKVLSRGFVFVFIRSCVVIFSFKPNILENLHACCLASELNKPNPRHRILNLPFFFRYKDITLLTFRLHKARVCPTGLGATFEAMFLLIYRLREFLLSAITNDQFEMTWQKQLLLLNCIIWPFCCTLRPLLKVTPRRAYPSEFRSILPGSARRDAYKANFIGAIL